MNNTIEFLERKRAELKNDIDQLNAKQMCVKVLINSCYGLTSSPFIQ